MTEAVSAPTIAEVRANALRISGDVLKTPIHLWDGPELRARFPVGEAVLKLELFQRTGTFKARGAVTSINALDTEARIRGVTAVSAGNHAIAVAYAAQRAGVSAKVVMLASANPARVARCRAWGAEVVIEETGPEAFARAETIQEEEGRAFIHPFEGYEIALGAGSLGLEFHEQAGALDALITPVGGGGLCAGVSNAIKQLQPQCRIFGVEPEGADTMTRSFQEGTPQSRTDKATIADSLAPPYALPYSFSICRANVERMVTISDDAMKTAMGVLFREMKLAVEPAGAAATAALFGPLSDELAGKRVGIIVCGANIDIEGFAKYVRDGAGDQM
jgi:threonine dehydratase